MVIGKNLWLKYDNFNLFSPGNRATLGHFLPKKSLYKSQTLCFCHQLTIFHKRKTQPQMIENLQNHLLKKTKNFNV